jgi:glucans biosynthesis protein
VNTPPGGGAAHEPPPYFHKLVERALALRANAAPAAPPALPPVLQSLNYQGYRGIRFRPERSLWRGEPGRFEAQFFHLGFYYREPVTVAVVPHDGGEPQHLAFSSDMFTYDRVKAPPAKADLGFAGFRLHAPINNDQYRDEVVVFQGASYFRVVGRGQAYGLSARALAIDTGEPKQEEFPRFTELYLVRPAADDAHVWVLAVLESARVTGAYAFRIEPGSVEHTDTLIEVTARVFPRTNAGKIGVLGLAPLTSMYLFGEDQPARFEDFRPEVHDSDGMAAVSSTGEWLYRPLRNPARTTTSSFRLDSPRGFGLVQRDREFASYQDLEAHYQDRPSIWIEPLGDWGKGALRLLEISTELETDDNIAMLWVPDVVPADGVSAAYRMHVGFTDRRGPRGRVIASRRTTTKNGERFLVDFASDAAQVDVSKVKVVVSVTGGKVNEQHVEANSHTKSYRASFEVTPDANARDVELRAFLKEGDDVLTETWSYLWQPSWPAPPLSAAARNR